MKQQVAELKEKTKNCKLVAKINAERQNHTVFYGFCPDHGCHEIDGGCGSHGLDMPEDLLIEEHEKKETNNLIEFNDGSKENVTINKEFRVEKPELIKPQHKEHFYHKEIASLALNVYNNILTKVPLYELKCNISLDAPRVVKEEVFKDE